MDSADPFDILAVSRDARPDEIRAAYRARARALHPDRRPGDAEAAAQFRRLRAAYEALANGPPPLAPSTLELFGEAARLGGVHVCRVRLAEGAERTLKLEVPAGTAAGDRLRVLGEALEVQLVPLPEGQRVVGKDLVIELPLALAEAALGARVKVWAGIERVEVVVPAGTAPGTELRVPGRGLGGDLVCRCGLVFPDPRDPSIRRALEGLAAVERSPRR